MSPCRAGLEVLVCSDRYAALSGSRRAGATLVELPICRPDGLNDVICMAGKSAREGGIIPIVLHKRYMSPCRAGGCVVTPLRCYRYRYVALPG